MGGMGYKQICAELTGMGCENAHGEVKWSVERIGRILRNATYKGYIGYNKSCSDGFLTQKRVNHREEDFVYVKVNLSPSCRRNCGIGARRCAGKRAPR